MVIPRYPVVKYNPQCLSLIAGHASAADSSRKQWRCWLAVNRKANKYLQSVFFLHVHWSIWQASVKTKPLKLSGITKCRRHRAVTDENRIPNILSQLQYLKLNLEIDGTIYGYFIHSPDTWQSLAQDIFGDNGSGSISLQWKSGTYVSSI